MALDGENQHEWSNADVPQAFMFFPRYYGGLQCRPPGPPRQSAVNDRFSMYLKMA